MEKAQTSQQPICGQEALDLLNCLAESPVDDERCNRLLNSLKACIREKKVKKFTLGVAEQSKGEADPMSKKLVMALIIALEIYMRKGLIRTLLSDFNVTILVSTSQIKSLSCKI
ncbi:hypothetical protein RJ640_019007 [Escallonia rubra]|uniref:Uncharacterized protein n=1 Tax=Escallonia rubra TaxID=112253 RepID=A0AA88TZF0_9ASTE|nr:hypothetical protein RJ640_019007 [Escallonia rubra]